jgi:hypothetical protein
MFFKGLIYRLLQVDFNKQVKSDKCHLNLAITLSAFSTSIVIKAAHIWVVTAFSVVPMKDLM